MKLAGKSTIINSTNPHQLTHWLSQQLNLPIQNLAEQPHQLDLQFITPATKTAITINQVRKAVGWLNIPAHQSGHKTLIICPADQLTLPAQNALLKPLEEPPHRALIILATTTPTQLLPTITSRCFSISLTRPNNPSTVTISNQLNQLVNALSHSTAPKRLALLPKKGLDQTTVRRHLAELTQATTQLSSTFPPSHLAKILKLISLAHQRLNSFVNPETVLADLYLAWPTTEAAKKKQT